MTTKDILKKFLDTWGKKVSKGTSSPLSNVEILTLEIFVDFCDKEKADGDAGNRAGSN